MTGSKNTFSYTYFARYVTFRSKLYKTRPKWKAKQFRSSLLNPMIDRGLSSE